MRKHGNFIARLLILYAFLYVTANGIGMKLPYEIPFIFTGIYFIAFSLFWSVKGLFKICLLLLAFAGGFAGLVKFYTYTDLAFTQQIRLLQWFDKAISYDRFVLWLDRISAYFQDSGHLYLSEKLWFYGLISFVVASIVFFFIEKGYVKSFGVIGVLTFTVSWIRYIDESFLGLNIFIVGFILLVVDAIMMDDYSKDIGRSLFSRWAGQSYGLIFGLVLVLLINGVMFVFPIDRINASLSEYMPVISSLRSGYTRSSGERLYSFNGSVYAPNGPQLGGPTYIRDERVMRISGDAANLHLKGRVMDQYNGNSWSTSNRSYSTDFDFIAIDSGDKKIRIQYLDMRTGTVFVPPNTKRIDLDREKLFMNLDGTFFYEKATFEENLKYYELYMDNKWANIATMTQEEIDRYQRVPESVTERTKDLTNSIPLSGQDDYSVMKSLTSYLRQNYPYTLNVNEVDPDLDFVDYFLFEEQRGYCTYYASALAVMGRIQGVPTRYVEGFLVPDEPDEEGNFIVTADLAHAWVEAYIEGVGWVTFDPTPAYQVENTVVGDGEEVDEEETFEDELLAFLEGRSSEEDFEEVLNEPAPPVEDTDAEDNTPEATPYDIRWILWLLGGLVVFAGLFLFFKTLMKKHQALSVMMRIKRIVHIIGTHEKPNQFGNVPDQIMLTYGRKYFSEPPTSTFADLLERILYTNQVLSHEEYDMIKKDLTAYRRRVRKERGIFTYYYALIRFTLRR